MSRKVKAVIGGIEIPIDDEEVKIKGDSGETDILCHKILQTLYTDDRCMLVYETERRLRMFYIKNREAIDKIAVYSGIGDYYDVEVYNSVMDFIEDRIQSFSECAVFAQVD